MLIFHTGGCAIGHLMRNMTDSQLKGFG